MALLRLLLTLELVLGAFDGGAVAAWLKGSGLEVGTDPAAGAGASPPRAREAVEW